VAWRSELLTRATLLRLTAARGVTAGRLAVIMVNGAGLRTRPDWAPGLNAVHTMTAELQPMPVVLVVYLGVAAARCLLNNFAMSLLYFMASIGWSKLGSPLYSPQVH
jgi:hypothetical protein